ncbi:MAG: maleylpyruvate isomerase family mycothiol-dependent enzyme [Actinomycetota bacterium]|nr:maleylpyruvate isomerase family mycothiol-dependent enzyme [Actinomycetota bacterium]
MSPTIQMTTTADAVSVAEAEYAALLTMLRALPEAEWERPTDCTGWTVRDIVAHVAGAADEAVHLTVQGRHMFKAKTRDRKMALVDSLSKQQIADREQRTNSEILNELAVLATRAPKARSRVPMPMRRMALPDPARQPGDSMGYLLDVIYPRDVWMHRIDISRATGCEMSDSGAEDVVVAQVVRDLQRAWRGAPFTLTLTGRGAGSWPIGGENGGVLVADTVDLCRLWSGRSDESSPSYAGPHTEVVDELRTTRLLF